MDRSRTTKALAALRLKKIPKPDWDHSLPVELLEVIFSLALYSVIDSRKPVTYRRRAVQPLLRNLARVCQAWYAMLTPMLYDEIYISSSEALECLARAVTKYRRLQPLVHSFQFYSIMFESARIDISEADRWNIKRIYRACPNISTLTAQRELYHTLTSNTSLESMGLDEVTLEKLTRLEVKLPHGVPCDGKLLFTSNVSLPNLQELILDVKLKEPSPNVIYDFQDRPHSMEWPRMPKLSRLCIKKWHVKHSCFTFPEHSERLRIIELLGGNYSSLSRFWYQDLKRYKSTLESLTITATRIATAHDYGVDFGEFTALTDLCVPISAFGSWDLFSLPFCIERFIISGSPENKFDEMDVVLLKVAQRNLAYLLELRQRSLTMGHLKLVRVMASSAWMWSISPIVKFEKATAIAQQTGVKLIFGFLEGEENSFMDTMKEKVFDNFPSLERKLQ